MMLALLLGSCAILLAFANGANDNMKGVATLIGSRVLTFRMAMVWANATTFAGVLTAVFLYRGLSAAFSGQGLVTYDVSSQQFFMVASIGAAAGTVLLATRLRLPVSTTHALVGGILGAGLAAAPSGIAWGAAAEKFLLPLAISPLLAATLTVGLALVAERLKQRLRVSDIACLCAEARPLPITVDPFGNGVLAMAATVPVITVGTAEACGLGLARLTSRGITVGAMRDLLHVLSSGAVCFARGLNDAPKIAAMMLAAFAVPNWSVFLLVGLAMVTGGILQARRVSETMSERITQMPHGQALIANIVTAVLVVAASRISVPVSTTHVSCGAIFGLGVSTGSARWKVISTILLAWAATLPLAATLGAGFYFLLRAVSNA